MTVTQETETAMRIVSATPVLRTADYLKARDFYVDCLGFAIAEEGGDPPRFGIFKRGGAMLFVDGWNGGRAGRADGWDAYLHVNGLDELHHALAAAGVAIARQPENTVYGMREFEVLDPDGNRLCFGEDA